MKKYSKVFGFPVANAVIGYSLDLQPGPKFEPSLNLNDCLIST